MEGLKHFQIKDYSKGVGFGMRQFEMRPVIPAGWFIILILIFQIKRS
jgi:hypothetical protein